MTKRKAAIETIEDVDPVVAEATQWFVTLHDEPADASGNSEFRAWREADPRHAAAYDRLSRLWGASGHLGSLTAHSARADRRSVLRGAASAALAVSALWAGGRLLLGPHPFADHGTGTGERRTVMLPDRSRVELSTATALSVDFSSRRRLVRLLDGEAWFQVARDPARPFIVEAAGGRTTALGTAFAVARQGDGARICVTEHAVRVVAGSMARTVGEGQSLVYGSGSKGLVESADPAALAWRSGRLAFVNRPLGEVAAELDRWTGGHTIVADEALAAHPVTLMTATQEAGDALVKLAAAVPMRITRLTSLLTIVRTP